MEKRRRRRRRRKGFFLVEFPLLHNLGTSSTTIPFECCIRLCVCCCWCTFSLKKDMQRSKLYFGTTFFSAHSSGRRPVAGTEQRHASQLFFSLFRVETQWKTGLFYSAGAYKTRIHLHAHNFIPTWTHFFFNVTVGAQNVLQFQNKKWETNVIASG